MGAEREIITVVIGVLQKRTSIPTNSFLCLRNDTFIWVIKMGLDGIVAKATPVIFAEPPSESVLTFGSPHKGNPCQSTKQLQTANQLLCFCFLCWPLLPFPRLQSVKLIQPTLSLAYLVLYKSSINSLCK